LHPESVLGVRPDGQPVGALDGYIELNVAFGLEPGEQIERDDLGRAQHRLVQLGLAHGVGPKHRRQQELGQRPGVRRHVRHFAPVQDGYWHWRCKTGPLNARPSHLYLLNDTGLLS
jgi:hypothetical protein